MYNGHLGRTLPQCHFWYCGQVENKDCLLAARDRRGKSAGMKIALGILKEISEVKTTLERFSRKLNLPVLAGSDSVFCDNEKIKWSCIMKSYFCEDLICFLV